MNNKHYRTQINADKENAEKQRKQDADKRRLSGLAQKESAKISV